MWKIDCIIGLQAFIEEFLKGEQQFLEGKAEKQDENECV